MIYPVNNGVVATRRFGASHPFSLFLLLGFFVLQMISTTGEAQAAVARVGAGGSASAVAATTLNVTIPATTAGNTLVAVIGTNRQGTNAVTGITGGGTWARVAGASGTNAGGAIEHEIWYCPNITAGVTTVTITVSTWDTSAVVQEYSGVLTASPLDASAINSTAAQGTALTSGSATATVSDLGIAGFSTATNATFTGPTGTWNKNLSRSQATVSTMLADNLAVSAGAATTSTTASASNWWVGSVALFKAVTGTTTLGNGVAGTTGNVCPAASGQKLDGFSFQVTSGTTDTITGLTVTTTNTSDIASVAIWNDAGTTQYFTTVSTPSGNNWTFSGGTAIPVTATATNYKILVTYKTRALAAAGNLATTANVTAWTGSNTAAGTDTADTTLILLNTHNAATWGTNSAGNGQNTLNWTYGTTGENVMIVRYTANTDTATSTDGTVYTVSSAFGTGGTVAYVGTLLTFTDTGLTNGTNYYYKVFEYDGCTNYATGVWSGVLTPTGPASTNIGNGVAGTSGNVCPAASSQKLDGFSLVTTTGTDTVTALTVTTTNTTDIASVAIWNEAGTTQYFPTVSVPSGNNWAFSGGTTIPVTTTSANYKILVTYKTRSLAAAGNLATTANVTAYTSTNTTKSGTDTADTTLTLLNTHNAATWGSNTAGGAQVTLNWTFGTTGESVMIVRYTANTDTTTPTDGTAYTVSSAFGTGGTVAYVGSLATFTDTGLTNGTTYYYKIFEYDGCTNYATGAWSAALTPQCIRTAPAVTFSPTSASIPLGSNLAYTVTVKNNDGATCSASTFTIAIGTETGATASFTLPSTLGSVTTGSLAQGATYNTTLTVAVKSGATVGNTNTTTVNVTDTTNHSTQSGSGSVVSTVSLSTFDMSLLHNANRFGTCSNTTYSGVSSAACTAAGGTWTATTKWTGTWGLSGGKYGSIDCTTCHVIGATNIKRVKTPLATPDGTNWASNSAATVAVTFLNVTSLAHGMGDDTRTPSTSSSHVCEVCHSANKYHNYNVANNTGGTAHNNGKDCISCHSHKTGFLGKGHTFPYGGSVHMPTGTGSILSNSGPPYTNCNGCHDATSNTGTYPVAAGTAPVCTSCHNPLNVVAASNHFNGTTPAAGCWDCHGNSQTAILTGANGQTVNSAPNGTTFPNRAGTHLNHMNGNYATASCSNCHTYGNGSVSHGWSNRTKSTDAAASIGGSVTAWTPGARTTGTGTCIGTNCSGKPHDFSFTWY